MVLSIIIIIENCLYFIGGLHFKHFKEGLHYFSDDFNGHNSQVLLFVSLRLAVLVKFCDFNLMS